MHPQVIEVMTKAMNEVYGNPSSIHTAGRAARKVLDDARTVLAKAIGAKDTEVIITSGGTEADNTAILVLRIPKSQRGSILLRLKLSIMQ